MKIQRETALSCNRSNFIECDRCVLTLLRLYLIQANENNSAFNQSQQTLAQFRQVLNQIGIIGLNSDGQFQFMTQRAEQLLSEYSLLSNLHTSSDLQQWFKHQISQLISHGYVLSSCLPLCIEQAGQQLIIRLVLGPIEEQYLLLLEERELQSFSVAMLELLGLTKREAEVLFWIAKDKSNAGIAKALGCSEGTVRKHLEHLYGKLGVQTRTAAVMVALEKLGLLKE